MLGCSDPKNYHLIFPYNVDDSCIDENVVFPPEVDQCKSEVTKHVILDDHSFLDREKRQV